MSYVRDSLTSGERVIYRARISYWVFGWGICWTLTGVFAIIGIPMIIIALIRCLTTEIAVTDKKLIAKIGVFGRRTIDQRLGRIDSISIKKGLIEGYGTIIVRGSGESLTALAMVADPEKLKRVIERAIYALEEATGDKRSPIQIPLAPGTDVTERLTRLVDLRNQGVLTSEEFEAQKRKILAD